MKLKNFFLIKNLLCKKARFSKNFVEKLAFDGLDTELGLEP